MNKDYKVINLHIKTPSNFLIFVHFQFDLSRFDQSQSVSFSRHPFTRLATVYREEIEQRDLTGRFRTTIPTKETSGIPTFVDFALNLVDGGDLVADEEIMTRSKEINIHTVYIRGKLLCKVCVFLGGCGRPVQFAISTLT